MIQQSVNQLIKSIGSSFSSAKENENFELKKQKLKIEKRKLTIANKKVNVAKQRNDRLMAQFNQKMRETALDSVSGQVDNAMTQNDDFVKAINLAKHKKEIKGDIK